MDTETKICEYTTVSIKKEAGAVARVEAAKRGLTMREFIEAMILKAVEENKPLPEFKAQKSK